MPPRVSSPSPLNAALRLRCWSRHAPAESATRSTQRSLSLTQATRSVGQRRSSRRSEGASRPQPMRNPRSGQLKYRARLNEALRAKRLISHVLTHLAQVQGNSFVGCRGLELGQVAKSARSGNAWPNPSLKPSPNSRALGRRGRACLSSSAPAKRPSVGPGLARTLGIREATTHAFHRSASDQVLQAPYLSVQGLLLRVSHASWSLQLLNPRVQSHPHVWSIQGPWRAASEVKTLRSCPSPESAVGASGATRKRAM
jgi:hypothetical protein